MLVVILNANQCFILDENALPGGPLFAAQATTGAGAGVGAGVGARGAAVRGAPAPVAIPQYDEEERRMQQFALIEGEIARLLRGFESCPFTAFTFCPY